jgi:hypothetical protein
VTDSAFLRLSAQRALLGAVGPNVLAVRVALDDGRLAFSGFVTADADDDEREALDLAASEMLADLPDVAGLDLEIEQVGGPSVPSRNGDWVFLRLGTGVDGPPA